MVVELFPLSIRSERNLEPSKNPKDKLKSIVDLGRIAEQIRASGQKVVLAHGVFDLLHMGHVRHLNEARTHGDVLFVTLTADAFVNKGPGKPVFSENLRAEMLAALSMVDYVAINHAPDAEDLLQRLRPDVYAKGSDYRDAEADVAGKINREREAGFTTLTLRPATVCG